MVRDIKKVGVYMKIEVNPEVYSYEALKIAKNIVDKEDAIKIENSKDKIIVIAEDKDAQLIDIFMNEALAQQCRIDTLKKNSKISEMITTLSIVSALDIKRRR